MEGQFFDISFCQNFISNLFATLIGVALGIPVALGIDRYLSGRKELIEGEEKNKAAIRRKNQLLLMIREALQKNLSLVEQMEKELRPEAVIFYNVDTQLLESTSSIKYEIIEDLDLNRRIDSIRYELLHLHRKVELQLDIEYNVYKAMGIYPQRRAGLVDAIFKHIPRIRREISEALSLIDASLSVNI